MRNSSESRYKEGNNEKGLFIITALVQNVRKKGQQYMQRSYTWPVWAFSVSLCANCVESKWFFCFEKTSNEKSPTTLLIVLSGFRETQPDWWIGPGHWTCTRKGAKARKSELGRPQPTSTAYSHRRLRNFEKEFQTWNTNNDNSTISQLLPAKSACGTIFLVSWTFCLAEE